MSKAKLLLPKSGRDAPSDSVHTVAEWLGVAESELMGQLLAMRTVFERTKPKKRNPSQHRVTAVLDRDQKIFNRKIQRRLYEFEIDPAVHGYVKGRSIWTNIIAHFEDDRLDQPLAWYGFDISDAFPSISHRWILHLVSENLPFLDAGSVGVLINLLLFRPQLAQGYPTSPQLFNLALKPLDEALRHYCGPRGIIYTRYADDFTFSNTRNFTAQERDELAGIVTGQPFRFLVAKYKEAKMGGPFEVTHRSTERVRRRLLRDRARGCEMRESIRNLQLGLA